MPKVSIGDIRLYYRVFRDGVEYLALNENELASSYLSETETVVTTEKPLKAVARMEVEIGDGNCLDPNRPTLVMYPGGPGIVDHSIYLDFWAGLSDVIQVVIVDQRGNGRSDRGDPDKWNMEQCADDVVLFCQALGIRKPLIAGVSWGGYVAMRYASKYPDHPGALILMHTEARVNTVLREEAFAARAVAKLQSLDLDAIKAAVRAYDKTPDKPGVIATYKKLCWAELYGKNPYQAEDFAACVTNIPMRYKFAVEENLQFDYRPDLPEISCHVLYVAGELDPAHPWQGGKEAASLMRDVEFIVMEGLGAPVYREDPVEVTRVVKEAILGMLPSLVVVDDNEEGRDNCR